MNIPLLIIIFSIFGIILASYALEGVDFVLISLLGAFIAATITGLVLGIDLKVFLGHVEWQAIIIILSMSLITEIAVESNILEFLAVKLFQIVKGEIRYFFFLLILLTTLLAGIVSDVVVILILAPVIVRLCRHLKVNAGTYLIGMTLSVKIGSIITPFGSSENIIISTYYGLDTLFFIEYLWVFSFILLFLMMYLLDKFLLSKEPKIAPQQKEFMLELVDSDVLVKNKKMFYFNSIAILIIIILFLFLPILYLTAGIGSLILVFINRKFTGESLSEMLKNVDWEIIFFLISLYIIIGSLLEAGFKELFQEFAFGELEPILLYIILFFIISIMSAFVSNTPTTLIFLPIIDTLISGGVPANPLFFLFIFGIHIGGNLIPQGAIAHMATLEISEKLGVKNLNYRRLLAVGFIMTIINMLCIIGFLFILIFFMGF